MSAPITRPGAGVLHPSALASAATPAASQVSGRPAPAEAAELDLGYLVGPVLLRRYGPTAAAVVITAIVTWFVARRGRR